VFVTKDDLILTERFPEEMAGMDFPGGKVFLDTSATGQLKEEWLARELVRAVQETRKKMGLKVKDKVKVYLPDEKAFKKSTRQIESETGSRIEFAKPVGVLGEFDFEGKKVRFGVKK
jgi:isoleucyl-tRNA synthetase